MQFFRGNSRHALAHVLWLGGSVCAGKSSISRLLAQRYPLQLHHYDRHEPDHVARSHPDRHPAITAFNSLTMDERWILRPPTIMAESSIQSLTERFEFVVEDLVGMSRDRPILVEGFGLFPECVSAVISAPRQALWLVAAPTFLTAMRYKRGMTAPDLTSDPERARQNLIARDVLMADYVRRQAAERRLTVVEVDGHTSIEDVAAVVAHHFQL